MYPGMEMISEAAGVAAGVVAALASSSVVVTAVCAALYIFQAFGLYTIAMRRGIRHPWMAWLPVANMWQLGSVSDQYRYVVHGQIRNRRKILLGLCIVLSVATLVLLGTSVAVLVKLIMQIPEIMQMTPQQLLGNVLASLLRIAAVGAVIWVLAIVTAVFRYVCMFDLYASCSPDNKVLFLVLSILFPVVMPVLVFLCRNKDLGMPPRKDAVIEAAVESTEE